MDLFVDLDAKSDLASAITIGDEDTMTSLMSELSEGLLNLAEERESSALSMVVPARSTPSSKKPTPFMTVQDTYLAPNKTIELNRIQAPQGKVTKPQDQVVARHDPMAAPPQNRAATPQVSLVQSVYHTRTPRPEHSLECIVEPVAPSVSWQASKANRIDKEAERPGKQAIRPVSGAGAGTTPGTGPGARPGTGTAAGAAAGAAGLAASSATARHRRLRTMLCEDATDRDCEPDIAIDAFRAWYATTVVKIVTRIFGRNDLRLVPHLESLADLYHHRRLFHQAEQLQLRALRLRKTFYRHIHESCARNFQGLARINRTTGKYPEATRLFQQAIDLHIRQVRKTAFLSELCHKDVDPAPIAAVLGALDESAQTLSEAGRLEDSATEFQRALKLWNNMPLVSSEAALSALRTLLLNYQYLLVRMNKYNEAEAINARRRFLYDDWRRERC
jgi:hypothetical protein